MHYFVAALTAMLGVLAAIAPAPIIVAALKAIGVIVVIVAALWWQRL